MPRRVKPAPPLQAALILTGGFVLIAWPIYFVPLMAPGDWLARRWVAAA